MFNKINSGTKFHILHIINHILFVVLITAFFVYGYSYMWIIAAFCASFYTLVVAANVGLHRYFAHRTFKTGKIRDIILTYSTVLTSLGSPGTWAAVHRLHHANSDKEGDPHNPREIGIWRVWINSWDPIKFPKRVFKNLLNTPHLKRVHKNYFLLTYSLMVILFIIHPMALLAFYIIPSVWCFHGSSAIGVLPHIIGYRSYDTKDMSRNDPVSAIISLGEGWHNNHHAHPGNWRQGEKWWEIDPPAFMIKHFFKIN